MLENENPLLPLSLCIPTNGVTAWVDPVLESIYAQGVAEDAFEVVITDNGDNEEFYAMVQRWCKEHSNLHYRKTTAQGFLNQIECFRDARGEYIKFVNHRMLLLDGTLQHWLNFVADNRDEKPICYFLNGSLSLPKQSEYDEFDGFVRALSYYSSWSGGLGIWSSDFIILPENLQYNILFPHTTILFNPYKNRRYIIDNKVLMESLPEDHPKGRYNLFYAFAVEYPSIIVELLRQEYISLSTVLWVKKEILLFLAELYIDYIIIGRKCSYDLTGVNESIDVYYSRWQLWKKAILVFLQRVKRKIIHFYFWGDGNGGQFK